jgi:3-deoxy-manno-octulosonate cytidylyltransferase (CMP-KDO synthetase)
MQAGRLERVESLEQLRVLETGHRIAVGLAPEPFPAGVDTPADLERAEARLAGHG